MFGLQESSSSLSQLLGSILAPVLVTTAGLGAALWVGGCVSAAASLLLAPALLALAARAERERRELAPMVARLRRLGIFADASEAALERLARGSGQVVSTSIDTGAAWSRVRELSEPDDEFVVDTPVASAGVRGTAFAIDCEGQTACTFSVVEGEVLVTPDVGEPATLTAGQSLTVVANEEPPAAQEPGVQTLRADEFIAKNLELDQNRPAEPDNRDNEDDADIEDGSGDRDSGSGTYEDTATYLSMEGIVGASGGRPEAGTTVPIKLRLSGICDGRGSCTATFLPAADPGSPQFMGPPIDLEPEGEGYGYSNTNAGGSGPCPILSTTTMQLVVDGQSVSGTFSEDPEATSRPCGESSAHANRWRLEFEGTRTAD